MSGIGLENEEAEAFLFKKKKITIIN